MKHKHNFKIITAVIFILPLIYIGMQLFVPSDISSSAQIEVEIPEGATYKQAINILFKNNLIRDKNLFIVLGKLTGLDRKIRYGYYSFWGKMSPFQVFKRLKDGRIIEYEITVVEGDSLLEIGQKLAEHKIVSIDDFNEIAADDGFLESLDINAPSIEGYIFPQTYKVPKGVNPKSVLKVMANKLREEFTDELKARARKIGWSENSVLTLASIIEKEAVTDEERPIISAVYHNRIKKGMPLQADPTAIYGVKSSRHKITREDLKKKTDYNTYVIKGLPPGPIASPGIKSIKAALYPAKVPYLYFVSQKDGTHYFSNTLSEHNAAIKRIRSHKGAARELSENKLSEKEDA
ncbi:MAG: endolytic transglycosylase MltG [Nitrospirae bacterium]|nr:endolytic transglycosylase MltG [Nitrospirota bacterium]